MCQVCLGHELSWHRFISRSKVSQDFRSKKPISEVSQDSLDPGPKCLGSEMSANPSDHLSVVIVEQ